jgi:hypothetical protein
VRLALGTFACICLETRFGPDIAKGAREAIRSYVAGLDSVSSPPLPFPSFRRGGSLPSDGIEIELCVGPEVQAVLEREARRQGVGVDELLTHAVFIHLAGA